MYSFGNFTVLEQLVCLNTTKKDKFHDTFHDKAHPIVPDDYD